MNATDYSESEARALVGTRYRFTAKNSLVPRGSEGQASTVCAKPAGGYDLVVVWQVNPAFILPEPITAHYSRAEVESQMTRI